MIFCQTKVLTDIIQQTVNGKGNPTKEDIFAVAKAVGLDATKTKIIIDEIAEKISTFNVF
jgi:DNA-binding phage protein